VKIAKIASTVLMPLLLGGLLVGCGSSGSTASNNANRSSNSNGSSKIHLTMASWRVEDTEGYKKIIQDFENKNPNIIIDFKPTKATEYDTTLDTALKGGDAADIIQLRPYLGTVKLADAGYLVPLDGTIQGLSNLSSGMADAAKGSDGKVYGVPLSVNSTQIYYNKKIFKDNNLSVPQTWDELMQDAKTLKAKGVVPFALGGKEGWILSLTHATVGPDIYGGTPFVNKVLAGQAKFTDQSFVDSIQRMKDMSKYYPDNFMGLSANDGMSLFFAEKAAMYIGGSFDLEPIRSQNANLDLGFFPVPPAKAGGTPTVTTWVDGSFGVNAKSANKDAALKFLDYMTTKDFGQLFADTFGRVAAVQGVEPSDPIVKQMADADNKYGTPYMMVVDFNSGTPTTKSTLENELQGMYLGKESPENVSAKVQASADSWFHPKK
jgi:raffinose/stachyose/melibiose transport system substrate-binding protein